MAKRVNKLGIGYKPPGQKPPENIATPYLGTKAPWILDTTDLKTPTTRLLARNKSLVIIDMLTLIFRIIFYYH